MWCIPPKEDAAFVCQMEQVLELYQLPYDPQYPVVGMDEQHKQLVSESRSALAAMPGRTERFDYEYVRHGACVVWMFTEPLAGWRDVQVTAHRTAVDWALQIQQLVDHPRYADAIRIRLVCDNLNTHTLASLYQTFPPGEALRLARKLELIYTPKHGSWLNVAECELSALTRQCLRRRIAEQAILAREAHTWRDERNATQTRVNWQFTTANARVKLNSLYPKFVA